jgi:hypothetical protein
MYCNWFVQFLMREEKIQVLYPREGSWGYSALMDSASHYDHVYIITAQASVCVRACVRVCVRVCYYQMPSYYFSGELLSLSLSPPYIPLTPPLSLDMVTDLIIISVHCLTT